MVAAGSITVAVRVRPPTTWEATRLPEPITDAPIRCDAALSAPVLKSVTSQSNLRHIIQVIDDRVLTFDPEEHDPSRAFVERGFLPPGTKRYKDRRFIFDRVFRHDSRQEEVYEGTAKPLLKNLLDGYNATIFAYGVSILVGLQYLQTPTCLDRLLAAERRTRLAALKTILALSTSQWPTSSGSSRIAEKTTSLTCRSHSWKSTTKKSAIYFLSQGLLHHEVACKYAKIPTAL